MEISSLNRNVNAASLPLERLAGSTKVSEKEKVAEATRQFESVLLKQILSQGQKPLFQNNAGMGSQSSNAIYQDMVTQQLADRISRTGSFGFAKELQTQLHHEKMEHDRTSKADGSKLKTVEADQSMQHRLLNAPPAVAKSTHVHGQPGKRI
jgi:Rod binding domain-containing protein